MNILRMERNNPKFVNTECIGGGIFPSKNTINNTDEYFESRKKKSYIFKYRRVSAGEICPQKIG